MKSGPDLKLQDTASLLQPKDASALFWNKTPMVGAALARRPSGSQIASRKKSEREPAA
jgi:hypothetical protein